MAVFWCALAAWQSWRSFARCDVSSGSIHIYWGLHLMGLVAPLLAVARLSREHDVSRERAFNAAVAIVVLTYVPMMIAMRLLELCLAAG